MAKYMADNLGNLTEVKALFSATVPYSTTDSNTAPRNNAADANKIIELDATGTIDKDFLPYRFITVGGTAGHEGMSAVLDNKGKWDISLMPVGIGAEVVIGITSGALAAGDFCNIHDSSGLKIRPAQANVASNNAHGFVLAAVGSGASATMYGISNENNSLAGLTVGADYWLSAATAGKVVAVAPQADGNWVQKLGVAHSATAMIFSNSVFGYKKVV